MQAQTRCCRDVAPLPRRFPPVTRPRLRWTHTGLSLAPECGPTLFM